MMFSPWVTDVDALNAVGYAFCVVLFGHLGLNLIIMAYGLISSQILAFRQWRIIKKNKERLKKFNDSKDRIELRANLKKFLKTRHEFDQVLKELTK